MQNSDLAEGYPSAIAVKDGMTENLIKIQGFADGNAGISLYKSDGIIHRIFLNADGRFRFGTYDNSSWIVANVVTNADIITKTITLTPITIAANSGTSGTSLDISDQIPAGYKLLDIRERSTGNNNCYVYYFNCIGTTVSYQIRNVSSSSVTTTPTATAVLMKS